MQSKANIIRIHLHITKKYWFVRGFSDDWEDNLEEVCLISEFAAQHYAKKQAELVTLWMLLGVFIKLLAH